MNRFDDRVHFFEFSFFSVNLNIYVWDTFFKCLKEISCSQTEMKIIVNKYSKETERYLNAKMKKHFFENTERKNGFSIL